MHPHPRNINPMTGQRSQLILQGVGDSCSKMRLALVSDQAMAVVVDGAGGINGYQRSSPHG
jgi:hypothetical protein